MQDLMKCILWGVQGVVLTFFVVVWIGENTTIGSDANPKWLKFSRYTTIGIFSWFLVVYLGVQLVLTKRVRLYFPKFYKQEKLNIVFATGAILVAIVSRVASNIWYIYNSDKINDSYNKNTWLFPNYQLVNAFTASIFPLAATILSLLYALNQKKKQFNVDAKTFDPRVSNRRRTERESIRSVMEDDDDSLVMGLGPNGDSEFI
jgi:magnesium-transporting ATPase (P-type)